MEEKRIKISSKNAIIEGNLAEMPLICFSKENIKANIITHHIGDSKNNIGKVEIRGSAKHGLPKEFDFDVLLALLRLFAKQKEMIYNQMVENDKDISNEDATLYFTLNELAKEMQKSTGGKNLKRLQVAIETLKDTTIHGSFYDKYKGKHVAKVKRGISVIDDYQLYEMEDKKGCGWRDIKEQTYVTFNKFYVRSIHNTYFKYYNYDQYLQLGRSGIAKKLYLLLCKWRNNRPNIKVEYEKLFLKIPLDINKDHKYNKKLLKNACEKLKKSGILYDYKLSKDKAEFYFTSGKGPDKKLIALKSQFNTFEQIQKWFMDQGFTQEEFMSYMNTIMYKIEYVKALIRYTEDMKSQNAINNPKAFVHKGMHLPYYEIDESYYN